MGVRSTLWTSRAAAKSPSVSWPALFRIAPRAAASARRDRHPECYADIVVFLRWLLFSCWRRRWWRGWYPDGAASILMEGRRERGRRERLSTAPTGSGFPIRSTPICKTISAFVRHYSAHRELSKPLFGSYKVLMGRGGRMFYLGNEMVVQSAGLVMRDQAVAQRTDLLARMNDEFRARGIRFLVAPPPNASSVYTDDLPLRAQNAGRLTEYDLLMSNLAAKGVPAVDLRPVLKAARPGGSLLYMHDTHWSFRGALVAYNAIVEADLHPDWRLDSNSALAGRAQGGDMAKILGLADKISEHTENLTFPGGRKIPLPDNDFIETFDKPGSKS